MANQDDKRSFLLAAIQVSIFVMAFLVMFFYFDIFILPKYRHAGWAEVRARDLSELSIDIAHNPQLKSYRDRYDEIKDMDPDSLWYRFSKRSEYFIEGAILCFSIIIIGRLAVKSITAPISKLKKYIRFAQLIGLEDAKYKWKAFGIFLLSFLLSRILGEIIITKLIRSETINIGSLCETTFFYAAVWLLALWTTRQRGGYYANLSSVAFVTSFFVFLIVFVEYYLILHPKPSSLENFYRDMIWVFLSINMLFYCLSTALINFKKLFIALLCGSFFGFLSANLIMQFLESLVYSLVYPRYNFGDGFSLNSIPFYISYSFLFAVLYYYAKKLFRIDFS